jgi:uncharacterized HAD superfamily protein
MKLSIDIDGVITQKTTWSYADSYKRNEKMLMAIKPNRKVIAKIRSLYRQGVIIILNTSRIWKDYKVTINWLKKYGVLYHTLIMAKPLADYYIDDKNLNMEEFMRL